MNLYQIVKQLRRIDPAEARAFEHLIEQSYEWNRGCPGAHRLSTQGLHDAGKQILRSLQRRVGDRLNLTGSPARTNQLVANGCERLTLAGLDNPPDTRQEVRA